MSFTLRDKSQREAALVELLLVSTGSADYRYTSHDETQTHLAQAYAPSEIVRRAMESGEDPESNGTLVFELPLDHELAAVLLPGAIAEPVSVTLFARHRDDSEFLTTFLGEVANVAPERGVLVVTCRAFEAALTTRIPRQLIQRTCPLVTYGSMCGVNPDDFDYEGEISAVDGRVITVTGAGTFAGDDLGYFVGGVMKKAGVIVGFIEAADGDDLTLLNTPSGLAVTDTVVLLAGDDRTIETCDARFGNVRRFRGHHAIPTRDPFAGRGLRP